MPRRVHPRRRNRATPYTAARRITPRPSPAPPSHGTKATPRQAYAAAISGIHQKGIDYSSHSARHSGGGSGSAPPTQAQPTRYTAAIQKRDLMGPPKPNAKQEQKLSWLQRFMQGNPAFKRPLYKPTPGTGNAPNVGELALLGMTSEVGGFGAIGTASKGAEAAKLAETTKSMAPAKLAETTRLMAPAETTRLMAPAETNRLMAPAKLANRLGPREAELAREEAVQLGRKILPEGNVKGIIERKVNRLIDFAEGSIKGVDEERKFLSLLTEKKVENIIRLAERKMNAPIQTIKEQSPELYNVLRKKVEQVGIAEEAKANTAKALSQIYSRSTEKLIRETAELTGRTPHKIKREILTTHKVNELEQAMLKGLEKSGFLKKHWKGISAITAIGAFGYYSYATTSPAWYIVDTMPMIRNEVLKSMEEAIQWNGANPIDAYEEVKDLPDSVERDNKALRVLTKISPLLWGSGSIYRAGNQEHVDEVTRRVEVIRQLSDKAKAEGLMSGDEMAKEAEDDAKEWLESQLKLEEVKQANAEKNQQASLDLEATKQYNEEENQKFWEQYLKNKQLNEKQQEEFWAEYQKNKKEYWDAYQKMKREEAPSKLGFGLL